MHETESVVFVFVNRGCFMQDDYLWLHPFTCKFHFCLFLFVFNEQDNIPLCKCTTFSLSAHQLMEWNLDCTNGLSWSLTVPSLSCSTWPFLDFKPSTPWGNLLTHYQVQLQYKTQPFSSLEHSFIIVSENTSQKISPQCSWSLLNHHYFLISI